MLPGPDELRRLAEQAGMDLDEEELALLQDQLGAMLAWAEHLPDSSPTPTPTRDPLP